MKYKKTLICFISAAEIQPASHFEPVVDLRSRVEPIQTDLDSGCSGLIESILVL